ncbi:PREDICTED: ankyrin repeat-containing protein ITN1-like [Ipomoea nil]|uniref:ankyrin repeat-containing protein ITN1-like n=1 Tax=Ipomoea nil TaxID=35883 RepID=UPI0009015B40|nr:PREDICTED: ankyrin repeat-containing protein ITN1-like [Ipomoea nil]
MSSLSNTRRRLACCSFQIDVQNPLNAGHRTRTLDVQIQRAALEGDWNTGERILRSNRNYSRDRITRKGETVLHLATAAKRTGFVRRLVHVLEAEDLEVKNDVGCTAFSYAAMSGVVENAKVMSEKNGKLWNIRDEKGETPIQHAVVMGHKSMVAYLCDITDFSELGDWEIIWLLEATIQNDMYDVATTMLTQCTPLTLTTLDRNQILLDVLARKRIGESRREGIMETFFLATSNVLPTLLVSNWMKEKCLGKEQGRRLFAKIWSECTSLTNSEFLELMGRKEILHYAAREGNVEFLDMILHSNPDLLWELNKKGQTILHVAVLHRQKKVVHLICNVRGYKDFIVLLEDHDRNNVLHLAATLQGLPNRTTPSQDHDHDHSILLKQLLIMLDEREEEKIMPQSLLQLSTAALQFEREISWFNEVEKIVPSSLHNMRNNDDKTAKQLFSKEHMVLKIEGEKSIRDTANSCMLVATLIATVAFAAAFTLSGGNEDGTGTPIFIAQTTFSIFTISDVVAMISSMLSIVTFLSILILRYTEDNFRVALRRLLFGLAALCVSIGGMLVAFTAAFFLVYGKAWQTSLIAAFAGVPVALFLLLNSKLWFDTIASVLRY